MVTDDDRRFARIQASLIYQNHVAKKQGLGGHIATEIGYEEMMRRGLLAECAWVHEFGGVINREILDHGDGGTDFPLRLFTPHGPRMITVNVKAKSVQRSWLGLVQSGTHLRVPVIECKPLTIYVFGIYLEPTDEASVLRWEWGRTLIRDNKRKVFPNSNGVVNYIRLFEGLRGLQELKERRL